MVRGKLQELPYRERGPPSVRLVACTWLFRLAPRRISHTRPVVDGQGQKKRFTLAEGEVEAAVLLQHGSLVSLPSQHFLPAVFAPAHRRRRAQHGFRRPQSKARNRSDTVSLSIDHSAVRTESTLQCSSDVAACAARAVALTPEATPRGQERHPAVPGSSSRYVRDFVDQMSCAGRPTSQRPLRPEVL